MDRVTRGRLSSWCVVVALAIGALGAGAIHFPVLLGFTLLIVFAACLACGPLARRRALVQAFRASNWREFLRSNPRGTVVLLVLWSLLALCWLQALPLPISWWRALAPENADIWQRASRFWGAAPLSVAPLSIAPGRTLIEGTKVAGYGLVFALAFRQARRDGIWPIATSVFMLGLLVAFATLALQLSSAASLYGLYRPLNATSVTPILNDNSLSGYLNVGIFAGLGLLARPPARWPKPLLTIGLMVLIATVITRQSRAATALLMVGLLTYVIAPGGLRSRSRAGRRRQRVQRFGVLAAIGCGGAILAQGALRTTGFGGLVDRSLEKVRLLTHSGAWALQQWGLGIGRGAFGSAFFVHQPSATSNSSFDHPENLWLQWGIEWGIPWAFAALLALAWALKPLFARRALRDPVRRGLALGGLLLLAQNTVDLGLELPALGALLAFSWGGLCGAAHIPDQRQSNALRKISSNSLRWGIALTTISLLLSYSAGSPLLTGKRAELRASLHATPAAVPAEFWKRLRAAMQQFPADPYLPLLGSIAASVSPHIEDPLPWISYALERGPQQAINYVQLARILHQRGARSQARGALRRAVQLSPREIGTVQKLSQTWALSPTEQLEVVPPGKPGAELLRRFAGKLGDRKLRLQWIHQATLRDASNTEGHLTLAGELLFHLRNHINSPLCPTNSDVTQGICAERLQAIFQRFDHLRNPHGAILQAQWLSIKGDTVGAEAQLNAVCQKYPENARCRAFLVRIALANGSDSLPHYIDQWVAVGCTTPQRCAATHASLGQLFTSHQQPNQALAHYRKAAEQWPTAKAWTAVAQLARQLDYPALAERSARKSSLLAPD